MSRLAARLVPYYEYDGDTAFACDGAAGDIVARRKAAYSRLRDALGSKAPNSLDVSRALEPAISDLQFTNANRVPFQFRSLVRDLPVANVAVETRGVKIRDMDDNWSYDVGGSYGVNLLGYDFYKQCMERAVARMAELGPVLGPYHPLLAENVEYLKRCSGLDEVSFHMSGTEAVMQAVRLARYHTGRTHLVMSCGSYHGWWDGVQPGVGSHRALRDAYMLKDLSEDTLYVLRTRDDIACVLVNPLQALHPNTGASSDATLINSERSAMPDREAYRQWLLELRKVCDEKSIVLIFDEVFVGFRLGLRGAQEYFGVNADMVTYGKTIGGGFPVGVLTGKAKYMRRYKEQQPVDVCFARGTFNSHPYVLAAMNEFLRHVWSDDFALSGPAENARWDGYVADLNQQLEDKGLPLQVRNLSSVWTFLFTAVSRYNWMLQYYLRAEGLALSWVGTGRFIFSHNYTDSDMADVSSRIIRAAQKMKGDGWWYAPPGTSNQSIRKQVLREMLAQRFSPNRSPASVVPARHQPSRDLHES